ncbi:hypothetical protein ACW9H7_31165, partial [Pseudomonas yamanorum]
RAHNPKVVGSNPAPATKHRKRLLERVAFFVPVCFYPSFQLSDKNPFSIAHLPLVRDNPTLICTYLTHRSING